LRKPLSEALKDALRPVISSGSDDLELSYSSDSILSERSSNEAVKDAKDDSIFEKF